MVNLLNIKKCQKLNLDNYISKMLGISKKQYQLKLKQDEIVKIEEHEFRLTTLKNIFIQMQISCFIEKNILYYWIEHNKVSLENILSTVSYVIWSYFLNTYKFSYTEQDVTYLVSITKNILTLSQFIKKTEINDEYDIQKVITGRKK